MRNKSKQITIKHIACFCMVSALIFVGCNAEQPNADPKESSTPNTSAQSIVYNGENRTYIAYIPEAYDNATATPLVLNFHGYGASAQEFMKEADMRQLAATENFMLVYPQGSLLEGSSHWNACPTGGDNKSSTDDFGFIETLIQDLSSQYNIDQSRIYAAGYSNGAMMAYGLANYKSERIAAVASVSGTMLDCIGNPQHPIPVLHLHGTADSVIPYNGDNYYAAAQNVLDHWIDFNNTRTIPVVSSESTSGIPIERYVYDQGDNAVSVEHYKYIGGEHVWFSSTFQGQSTAELIWSFLSKYDINGLR